MQPTQTVDQNVQSTTTQLNGFWQGAVVYQVYPWSFNEDKASGATKGHGTIRGITERVDYFADLGVNAIWISPFYPSPMADSGYDIEDYRDVHPDLGTIQDFNELVQELHENDIRLMIDLVPNHTSDQHPWFKQSRASKDNDKSDWYIWRDPNPDGSPPNNWGSVFSHSQLFKRQAGEMPELRDDEPTPYLSAWQYDETRGQYYLHSFAVEQPDLNWENPAVRAAIQDVMRYWIDRGVDGFRIDAVNFIGKDMRLTDEPMNPDYIEGVDNPYDRLMRRYSSGYPDTFYSYLNEFADVLEEEEYRGRDLRIVFEAYMDEKSLDRINRVAPGVAGAFNFGAMGLDWEARLRKAQLDEYYKHLPPGIVANQVNGNHDKPRLASRIGEIPARAAAVHNLMLPGMPFIYQGEEGGFTDVEVPLERQRDRLRGRDIARTPMLWDDTNNAGFSNALEAKLWLPIDPEYKAKHLAGQRHDPTSSYSLYRALLAFRNGSTAVHYGDFSLLATSDDDVLGFVRRYDDDIVVTMTNFSDKDKTITSPELSDLAGEWVLSSLHVNINRPIDMSQGFHLEPHEAIVVCLQGIDR
jgi:alpha-glucosidase